MPLPQITVQPSLPTSLGTTPTAQRGSFTRKLIEVTIQLATNTGLNQPNSFAGAGSGSSGSSLKLAGFRTSVRVQNSGTPAGSEARVLIYGLNKTTMDQLSTLGMVRTAVPANSLSVTAGDAVSGQSLVFSGTIAQAFADYAATPDVPIHFECRSGLAAAVLPAVPSSYSGATDVGTIMSSIAKAAGWGFENSGVNISISNPYLAGSYGTQWEKLARAAGINAALVPGGDTATSGGLILAIWPKDGARRGQAPLVAPPPEGSMVLYPSNAQYGIQFKTLYNPQISFGGQIVVRGSSIERANGTWNVYKLDHQLDSLVPKGLWESDVHCYSANAAAPVILPR